SCNGDSLFLSSRQGNSRRTEEGVIALVHCDDEVVSVGNFAGFLYFHLTERSSETDVFHNRSIEQRWLLRNNSDHLSPLFRVVTLQWHSVKENSTRISG
ncbi:hypothetical protein PFISCL1PPCAC_14119, partial [Pristionchus fissidentatus]